jgi:hypothetical protein
MIRHVSEVRLPHRGGGVERRVQNRFPSRFKRFDAALVAAGRSDPKALWNRGPRAKVPAVF